MPESNAVLESAALDAFEQLGFLLADLESAEPTRPLRGMAVAFRGPVTGRLEVWADETLLETLAMNMIGGDAPPSRDIQLDALGEMANVICGNVLPALEDAGAVFRLAAPAPVGEPAGECACTTVQLGFEGGIVRVDYTRADP